jgi:hypothetical protein
MPYKFQLGAKMVAFYVQHNQIMNMYVNYCFDWP